MPYYLVNFIFMILLTIINSLIRFYKNNRSITGLDGSVPRYLNILSILILVLMLIWTARKIFLLVQNNQPVIIPLFISLLMIGLPFIIARLI